MKRLGWGFLLGALLGLAGIGTLVIDTFYRIGTRCSAPAAHYQLPKRSDNV